MTSLEMVRACGSMGYVVMALGVLGVLLAFAAAIAAVATTNRKVILTASGASLAVGVLIGALSSLGAARGEQRTDRALSESSGLSASDHPLTPEEEGRLRAIGYAQAAKCVPVGVLSAALPFAAGAVVLMVTLMRKNERKNERGSASAGPCA